MLDRESYYDVTMFLSIIAIIFFCSWMIYFGVRGIVAHYPIKAGENFASMAYAIFGYLLFILIPLMIAALVLSNVIISRVFEIGFDILSVVIILDIILMTIFYLLS
jgi:hypothetical protein